MPTSIIEEITFILLININFSNSYFKGANLQKADLSNSNLMSSNFKNANFFDAILTGTNIDKINFSGALFCRTIMPSGKKNNKDC